VDRSAYDGERAGTVALVARHLSGSSHVPLARGLTGDAEYLCDLGPARTEATQSSDLDFHGHRGSVAADHQRPQAIHVDFNSPALRPLEANHLERVVRSRDRRPTCYRRHVTLCPMPRVAGRDGGFPLGSR
jgi:hypothetical protein